MSNDHRPNKRVEKSRILHSGCKILNEPNQSKSEDGAMERCYDEETGLSLSVSRTFGDFEFKHGSSCAIIHEPQVKCVDLTDDDEFVIIGCDGIFDVLTNSFILSLINVRAACCDD